MELSKIKSLFLMKYEGCLKTPCKTEHYFFILQVFCSPFRLIYFVQRYSNLLIPLNNKICPSVYPGIHNSLRKPNMENKGDVK